MRIILSDTLSYCFGVKKTLAIVDELLSKNDSKKYYMLGEVVHNEHVIDKLNKRGLQIIASLDEVTPNGIVILQSHGTPISMYEELRKRKIEYVDTTCPMVRNIHVKIRQLEKQGYTPIVLGKEGHDEVRGIQGQVKKSIVIKEVEEVTPELFKGIEKAGIVVQSTCQPNKAYLIVEEIKKLVPDVLFHDTICEPTKTRQSEIEEKSKLYDCNIIIGSKKSANTMHLFHIAFANNPCTYLIDSLEAARNLKLPKEASVFIASGASTPEHLIQDVIQILKSKTGEKSTCTTEKH